MKDAGSVGADAPEIGHACCLAKARDSSKALSSSITPPTAITQSLWHEPMSLSTPYHCLLARGFVLEAQLRSGTRTISVENTHDFIHSVLQWKSREPPVVN
jgi:hypothetical protein